MADVGSRSLVSRVSPQALRIAAGTLLAIGLLDAVALASGGGGGSPLRTPSHASVRPPAASSASLAAQYGQEWRQVDADQQQLDQQSFALTSDISDQEQRIQNDSITYSANEFGLDCAGSVSVSNVDAYGTCVNEEEQTATDAETDTAAANTQLATDRQRLMSMIAPLLGGIDDLVQQLAQLPWPTASLRKDAEALSGALGTERTDLEEEASALQGSNFWSGEHDSVQVTADGAAVARAAAPLDAALGLSGVGSPATAVS